MESLKIRYNDLVDCYNELEQSSIERFRQLRKDTIKLCPEKALQIEKIFEESLDSQRQPGSSLRHPVALEERASEEEEDSTERQRRMGSRPSLPQNPAVPTDISKEIERLNLQLFYYE